MSQCQVKPEKASSKDSIAFSTQLSSLLSKAKDLQESID